MVDLTEFERRMDGTPDRALSRLSAAGKAMRTGMREELRAAAEGIFQMALEQARADLDIRLQVFEAELRQEMEALRDDVLRQAREEGGTSPALEAKLDRAMELIQATHQAVLRLSAEPPVDPVDRDLEE
jgi:F0F1-type ATP synthase membrane subunit b/b'